MADLTVTAASVLDGSGASVNQSYDAAATITAGQTVYLNASNKWDLAINDDTAVKAGSSAFGVALHGASLDQPLAVMTNGPLTVGATVVVGTLYVLSGTAGGICPEADLTTGDRITTLGYATTAAIINLQPNVTGLVAP